MGVIRQPNSEFYDVTDGIWIGPGTSCIYISDDGVPEELIEHAPALALAPYGQVLLQRYPELQTWIEDNPAPDEDEGTEDNEPTALWWREFGRQLLKRGWHLLWRAELYTTSEDVTLLPAKLAGFSKEAGKLDWPEDCDVEVNQLREREIVTSSFLWSAVVARVF